MALATCFIHNCLFKPKSQIRVIYKSTCTEIYKIHIKLSQQVKSFTEQMPLMRHYNRKRYTYSKQTKINGCHFLQLQLQNQKRYKSTSLTGRCTNNNLHKITEITSLQNHTRNYQVFLYLLSYRGAEPVIQNYLDAFTGV